MIISISAGVIFLMISGVDLSSVSFEVNHPTFVIPSFSFEAFLIFGLPLTIILIGMETPAGVGIVKSMGYKNVPVNGITAANGLGTIVGSFFNLHSTCIAAPMTGICSSPDAGEKEGRWIASVLTGILWVSVSPFFGTVVKFIESTPDYFIAIIAGAALIKVLSAAMTTAFQGSKYIVGSLFAFLIAASGIELLGIGAPFWALIIGVMVSLIIESKDFG